MSTTIGVFVIIIIHRIVSTASESVSFSGSNYIRYEVVGSTSSRRAARQTSLYQTGRDYITMAFITSSDSGTLLTLGYDRENSDYAVLEV